MKAVYVMVALYLDGGFSTSVHPTLLTCQKAARHVAHTDFDALKRDRAGNVRVPDCVKVTKKPLAGPHKGRYLDATNRRLDDAG